MVAWYTVKNHHLGLLTIAVLFALRVPACAQSANDVAALSLDSLLDNIVEAASKHEETLEESPANVVIVSRDMIEDYGCRTVAEALSLVPGMYITDDYSLTQIGVRGVSTFGDWNTHTLVLIDGRPMSEQYGGTSSLDVLGLTIENVERIEVIKGPASSLYGSNAFLGIVNVISRRFEENQVRATGSYYRGTDTRESSVALYRRFNRDWTLSMTGSLTDRGGNELFFSEFSDLSDSTLLRLDDDGYNQFYFDSASFTGGWARDRNTQENIATHNRLTWRDCGLTVHYARVESGVAHSMWGSLFQNEKNRFLESRMYVDLDYTRRLSEKVGFFARLGYNRYDYDDYIMYNYASLAASPAYLPGPIWRDTEYDRCLGAEFRLDIDFSEGHRLTMGGEGQYHEVGHSSGETDAGGETILKNAVTAGYRDATGEIYNLFLQDEYRLTSYAKVVGGLHLNYYTYTTGQVVPKGALVMTPYSGGTFKLIASRGYRSPTFYELTYDDGLLYYRNRDLGSEWITSYEFLATHRFRYGLTFDLAVNTSRITDMIQQTVVDASDPDHPGGTYDDPVYQFRNHGEFRTNSVEGCVRTNPLYRWSGFANVTWQDMQAEDDTEQLTFNSPRWLANAGLTCQISEDRLSVATKVQHVSSRQLWDGSRMPGVWTIDLTARSRGLLSGLEFGLTLKNLLDETSHMPLSPEFAPSTTIDQPGRSIYLTVRMTRGW